MFFVRQLNLPYSSSNDHDRYLQHDTTKVRLRIKARRPKEPNWMRERVTFIKENQQKQQSTNTEKLHDAQYRYMGTIAN
jgi:hypothetical protein